MKDAERRIAAKEFAEYWKDRGYEKGESQPFWLSLIRDVLGVKEPEKFISDVKKVSEDVDSNEIKYFGNFSALISESDIPSAISLL